MEHRSSAKAELRRLHRLAKPLRVLHVASAAAPLSGTVADEVAGGLPKALARLGAEVRVLMPAYPSVLDQFADVQPETGLDRVLGQSLQLLRAKLPDADVPVWLLDCPALYRCTGTAYHGSDNALPDGVLCHVAAALALGRTAIAWRPEVVHCHGWRTGLVPLLLRRAGNRRPRSVFMVHEAASRGIVPLETAALLDVPEAARDAALFGRLSFLKCGAVYADAVTVASQGCARELRTPEFDGGMENAFEDRAADLHVIPGGIDAEVWNPATDPSIARRYSIGDPAGKLACKAALQAQLGLRADPSAPLALFVGGLTAQNMADVVLERLPGLLHDHPNFQFVLSGCGERDLEEGFVALARRFPDRVSVDIGCGKAGLHPLYAGSDLLLHGSRSGSCEPAPLHAMRYGTLPIVRRAGGLGDAVVDVQLHTRHRATGFVCGDAGGDAFEGAVRRALDIFEAEPLVWRLLRLNAMLADFDWQASAQRYLELYAELAVRGVARSAPRAIVRPGLRAGRIRLERVAQAAPACTAQAGALREQAAPGAGLARIA